MKWNNRTRSASRPATATNTRKRRKFGKIFRFSRKIFKFFNNFFPRCETSLDLDSPVPEPKQYRPRIESPTTIDVVNNNHQIYENMHSPQLPPTIPQHFQNYPNGNFQGESIYLNPLANANSNPPNIPPKSKLRYSESTRSTVSNRDIENNIIPHMHHMSPPIQVESPKNVTIIQEGSWQPYKEEIKAYEISDFYKYSQKYRQQQQQQKQHNEC